MEGKLQADKSLIDTSADEDKSMESIISLFCKTVNKHAGHCYEKLILDFASSLLCGKVFIPTQPVYDQSWPASHS